MLQWFTSYNNACCASCPLRLADYPSSCIDTSHRTSHFTTSQTRTSHFTPALDNAYKPDTINKSPTAVFALPVYAEAANKTWQIKDSGLDPGLILCPILHIMQTIAVHYLQGHPLSPKAAVPNHNPNSNANHNLWG